MSNVGLYLEYHGGYSVPWWDIMMHMGDIMCTVGDTTFCYLSTPMVLNTPTVLMIYSHMYHEIPHGTENPLRCSR